MSKELTFKSGSEELRKFCESADAEAVMQRFGKYLNLDDPETKKNAELIAEEL